MRQTPQQDRTRPITKKEEEIYTQKGKKWNQSPLVPLATAVKKKGERKAFNDLQRKRRRH